MSLFSFLTLNPGCELAAVSLEWSAGSTAVSRDGDHDGPCTCEECSRALDAVEAEDGSATLPWHLLIVQLRSVGAKRVARAERRRLCFACAHSWEADIEAWKELAA